MTDERIQADTHTEADHGETTARVPAPIEDSPGSDDRKSVAEMLGEFLREVAALVAVFSILDKLVAGDILSSRWLFGAFAVSFALLLGGIVLERLRKAH